MQASSFRKCEKSSIKELFHTVVNVLFAELLELVGYELNLSSYDNLHACLAWADNAGNTCGFDLLLIYESLILYLQTETCDAVVDGSYIGWPPSPSRIMEATSV